MILVSEETWNRLQEKYDVDGYTDSIVYINLDSLIKLDSKIEAVQQWAFQMECMYEDCSYLSHEAFDEDAKKALKELINIVGKWIPPEVCTSAEVEI